MLKKIFLVCLVILVLCNAGSALDWTRGTSFFDALYCKLVGCTITGDLYVEGNLTVGAGTVQLDVYYDDKVYFNSSSSFNFNQNATFEKDVLIDGNLYGDYIYPLLNNVVQIFNLSVLNDLRVFGNGYIIGDLDVEKNFTGNQIIGELWNYTSNSTAWEFPIAADSIYYNLTNLTDGSLNGFYTTHANDIDGGSYMTAQVAGTYKIILSISAAADAAGSLFSFAAVRNFDVDNSRNCYARRTIKSTPAGAATVDCYLDLDVGDTLNVQLENEENTQNIFVHTVNLNAMRVGD